MSQLGARQPITGPLGYQEVSPSMVGWQRLRDLLTIPPEATGALIVALSEEFRWCQSPLAMPVDPFGIHLPNQQCLTLHNFTQIHGLCVNTQDGADFAVQFFTGPVGRLPEFTNYGTEGGGGGGGSVDQVTATWPLLSSGGSIPNISVARNGVTRAQMQSLIAASTLIPGWSYLVTDATSRNLSIIVTATGTNTLAKTVQMVGDSFDHIEYDIAANVLNCYDEICCIVESDGTAWRFIDNSAHAPKGMASVGDWASNSFRVVYARADYTHVINSTIVTDEALALRGWSVGASVGLASLNAQVFLHDAWANLNGPAFVLGYGQHLAVDTAVWSSADNALLIATPQTEIGPFVVQSTKPQYRCIAWRKDATTTAVQFVDNAGNIATAADGNMGLSFQRRSPLLVNATQFYAYAGWKANCWIRNLMLKRIS